MSKIIALATILLLMLLAVSVWLFFPKADGSPDTRDMVKDTAVNSLKKEELASTNLDVNADASVTFQDCDECPLMIEIIPAPMGNCSGKSQKNNLDSAKYSALDNSYALSVTEVTGVEWKKCFDSGACDRSPTALILGDEHVVSKVTVSDAHSYLNYLSEKSNHNYRLPTEVEWEYAASGGYSCDYLAGKNSMTDVANYAESNIGRQTIPRQYPPNRFGLYDMVGNVSELTSTCFGEKSEVNENDQANCRRWIVKGGDYNTKFDKMKISNQEKINFNSSSTRVGLRVARDAQ